jgi:hypothetical protein
MVALLISAYAGLPEGGATIPPDAAVPLASYGVVRC